MSNINLEPEPSMEDKESLRDLILNSVYSKDQRQILEDEEYDINVLKLENQFLKTELERIKYINVLLVDASIKEKSKS